MHSFDSLSASEIAEKLLQALRQGEGADLAPEDADQLVKMAAALYEKAVVARHEAQKPAPVIAPPAPDSHHARAHMHSSMTNVVDDVESTPDSMPVAKQINLLDVIKEMESTSETEPEPTAEPEITEKPETVPEPEFPEEPEFSTEPEIALSVTPEPQNEISPAPVKIPEPQSKAAPTSPSSINDKLSTGLPKRSLADKLALTPLPDIKKAISLNLKFQFINELFSGDAAAFEAAIFKLDTATDGKTAMTVLEHELLSARGWDVESKVFLDLHTLVERRYL